MHRKFKIKRDQLGALGNITAPQNPVPSQNTGRARHGKVYYMDEDSMQELLAYRARDPAL